MSILIQFKKMADALLGLFLACAAPIICHYIALFFISHLNLFTFNFYGQDLEYSVITVVVGLLFIAGGALLHFDGMGAGMIFGGAIAILFSSVDFFSFIHDYSQVALFVPAMARLFFFGAGLAALIAVAYCCSYGRLKTWALRFGIMILLPFALYAAITLFLAMPAVAKALKRLLYYYYRETFNLLMVFFGVVLIIIGSHIKKRAVNTGIVLGALFCLLFPLIEIILGRFH